MRASTISKCYNLRSLAVVNTKCSDFKLPMELSYIACMPSHFAILVCTASCNPMIVPGLCFVF